MANKVMGTAKSRHGERAFPEGTAHRYETLQRPGDTAQWALKSDTETSPRDI